MTHRPDRGVGLRQCKVMIRFEAGVKPGPRQDHLLSDRVSEVRKWLRTNLPIEKIADELGVCPLTLRGFIKRRNLCNLRDRAHFISQQKSLEKVSV